jgi:hypothetical protein
MCERCTVYLITLSRSLVALIWCQCHQWCNHQELMCTTAITSP